MALANATEGAARATVLRTTQMEPSRGFVAWQALVDGYAPKSSNDPAIALQLIRKGANEWTSGKRDDGGKKGGERGSKGSKPDWYGDRDKGGKASKGQGPGKRKGKGKGKGKSETRSCYDSGEHGYIGVSCPHKWTNSIDDQEDQGYTWESEPEGERAEELASLETHEGEC